MIVTMKLINTSSPHSYLCVVCVWGGGNTQVYTIIRFIEYQTVLLALIFSDIIIPMLHIRYPELIKLITFCSYSLANIFTYPTHLIPNSSWQPSFYTLLL